jgi:hypothetical protein
MNEEEEDLIAHVENPRTHFRPNTFSLSLLLLLLTFAIERYFFFWSDCYQLASALPNDGEHMEWDWKTGTSPTERIDTMYRQ